MPSVLIKKVQEQRAELRAKADAAKREYDALLDGRVGQKFTASEKRQADNIVDRVAGLNAQIREADDRIDELLEQDHGEHLAAEHRSLTSQPGEQRGTLSVSEESVYRRDGVTGSFFLDLRNARLGDAAAIERLRRNQQDAISEKRALSTTATAGGEFAPPAWLVNDFVPLVRAARVTADLCHKQQLPEGKSSINLPSVASGTTTAVQTTQNSSVSDTDLTTASVSSGITTIAGKQVIALQLIEQSGIPFDQVVMKDLAADYAKQLDTQVISGSGTNGQLRGLRTISGSTSVTYTASSPTVTGTGGLYQKMAELSSTVQASRYLPITSWVMTPARWAWIASSFDSQNRPLVVPSGPGMNAVATADQQAAEGKVGEIMGVPVYLDPNLPADLGTGTDQDIILGLRGDDVWLWESALKAEAFDAPYADSLGLLVRVYAYSALIADRYPQSVGILGGTGLVTPTFA